MITELSDAPPSTYKQMTRVCDLYPGEVYQTALLPQILLANLCFCSNDNNVISDAVKSIAMRDDQNAFPVSR